MQDPEIEYDENGIPYRDLPHPFEVPLPFVPGLAVKLRHPASVYAQGSVYAPHSLYHLSPGQTLARGVEWEQSGVDGVFAASFDDLWIVPPEVERGMIVVGMVMWEHVQDLDFFAVKERTERGLILFGPYRKITAAEIYLGCEWGEAERRLDRRLLDLERTSRRITGRSKRALQTEDDE